MPRPRDLPIVDLLVELPRGGSAMGMEQARKLTKGYFPGLSWERVLGELGEHDVFSAWMTDIR